MAKKQMNPKAQAALAKWRASLPKDKNGKTIYPARKSRAEVLKAKKLKLAELKKQVAALEEEISKAELSINNKEIENKFAALKGKLSYEQLVELLDKANS